MKRSKLQPDLKCSPSSSRAEARDQTGKEEKFAFLLLLEQPAHHKLANWALPPIASGQPPAARMPRPQPPHQPQCLREAGPRPTARVEVALTTWMHTHTPRVACTHPSQAHFLAAVNKGGRPKSPPLPSVPCPAPAPISLLHPRVELAGHLLILFNFFRNHRVLW